MGMLWGYNQASHGIRGGFEPTRHGNIVYFQNQRDLWEKKSSFTCIFRINVIYGKKVEFHIW